MNLRSWVLLFATVFVLFWSVVAAGADNGAVAAPLSPNEERLYQLFERQLNTLTLIITGIVGAMAIVQVLLSYSQHRRQRVLQMQNEAMTRRMMELTEHSVRQLEEHTAALGAATTHIRNLETAKRQNRQALWELSEALRPLAEGKDTRFDKSKHYLLKPAADEVARIQYTHGARDEELPAAAHLIRGYCYSVIQGEYRRGADEFGKVIADIKASSKEEEIALFNRGIDRANMRQYDLAIEDFKGALALDPGSLFYRFYRLDTLLLKVREERGPAGGLATEFGILVEAIQQAHDRVCEPLTRRQLLTRALRSYASLLIFEAHDYERARAMLQDQYLREDLIAQYLALIAQEKANPGHPLEVAAVTACLEKAKTEHSLSIEPRSRLLRSMILQQCYLWSPADHKADLNALRSQLLADIAALEKQGGDKVTVFSPLSQKNETLRTIREQVGGATLTRSVSQMGLTYSHLRDLAERYPPPASWFEGEEEKPF